MRPKYEMDEKTAREFLAYAEAFTAPRTAEAKHFLSVMETNVGAVGMMGPAGRDEKGLERRNPVVTALGDSVTAGHFDFLIDFAAVRDMKEKPKGPIEAVDAGLSYIEQLRQILIDYYDSTSVSFINAGIAGDNLRGMEARMTRDVVSHSPDLVILNGSLNWGAMLGTNKEYGEILRRVVGRLKAETDADIVLMTSNMAVDMKLPGMPAPLFETPLIERVEAVREVAAAEQVCLADVYAMWESFTAQGHELKPMLANGINHPTPVGHKAMAQVIWSAIRPQ